LFLHINAEIVTLNMPRPSPYLFVSIYQPWSSFILILRYINLNTVVENTC